MSDTLSVKFIFQWFQKMYILLWIFAIGSSSAVVIDKLNPYPAGGHLDRLRTHRYVRSCQPIIHGNLTFESIQPKNVHAEHETKYIAHKFNGKDEFGHRTVVRNPYSMISVLEPLKPGSCESRTTAYVHESAAQENCQISVNAGFFMPDPGPDYGKCLGNIISNGRLVNDYQGIQNANFGIRQDGTVVIGYLSEDEVLDKNNPFIQLLSGVGWILRNGESYLDESEKAECRETETTGALKEFFSVQSARTMIGYDKEGHVHVVQFDGKTHERGISLYDAVDYLKSIGLVNAINFDGGGSATYVHQTTVMNYPSNKCGENNDELCERNVSTIICIKDVKSHTGTYTSMTVCCNRNYLLVILLSVLVGCCLLALVFVCNAYTMYKEKVAQLTSTHSQREALKSLLDGNRYSSDADSEADDADYDNM